MAEYAIQVISGGSAGRVAQFSNGSIEIGRDPQYCKLIVDDPNVSRRHARLTHNGRDVVLEDLNSTNGTIVNGSRATSVVLRPGDRILVGNSELSFTVAQRPASPQNMAVPPGPAGPQRQSSMGVWVLAVGAILAIILAIIFVIAARQFTSGSSEPDVACQVGMGIGVGGACSDFGLTIEVDQEGIAIVRGNIGGVPIDAAFESEIDVGNLRAVRHEEAPYGIVWRINSLPSNPVPVAEP